MSDLAIVAASDPATSLLAALKERRPVLVTADPHQLPPDVTERLVESALRPGVASASPVPVAGVGRAVAYQRSELSPPAPTLAPPSPLVSAPFWIDSPGARLRASAAVCGSARLPTLRAS